MTTNKRFEVDFLILTVANSSAFELTNNMELLSGRNWILPKENTLACFKSGAQKSGLLFFVGKRLSNKSGFLGFHTKGPVQKIRTFTKVTTQWESGF